MKRHIRKIVKVLKARGCTVTVGHTGSSHYRIIVNGKTLIASASPKNEDHCIQTVLKQAGQ